MLQMENEFKYLFCGVVFLVYSFENTKSSESLKLMQISEYTLDYLPYSWSDVIFKAKMKLLNEPPKQTNKIVLLFWQSWTIISD